MLLGRRLGRVTEAILHAEPVQRLLLSGGDTSSQVIKTLAPDETFWYFSGRSSNEAGFLLQLFARLYGTNNVNNCSYYCHQASGVGLTSSLGTGTATVTNGGWTVGGIDASGLGNGSHAVRAVVTSATGTRSSALCA